MYVCMYVFMYVCMCVCMSTCVQCFTIVKTHVLIRVLIIFHFPNLISNLTCLVHYTTRKGGWVKVGYATQSCIAVSMLYDYSLAVNGTSSCANYSKTTANISNRSLCERKHVEGDNLNYPVNVSLSETSPTTQ